MEILEAAAGDYMSESWVDTLVDVWPDIMNHALVMEKLPKILDSLSRNIVTNEILEKLTKLKQHEGSSRAISALLDDSIETAGKNVKWFQSMRRQFAKAFNTL